MGGGKDAAPGPNGTSGRNTRMRGWKGGKGRMNVRSQLRELIIQKGAMATAMPTHEGSEIGILRKEGDSYKEEAKVIGYKSGGGGDQNKEKVIYPKGH
jgi:hypothetical protein